MNHIRIRKATSADCKAMMALIHELAAFENAAEEVTVSLQEFEESGFGADPVWWAFIAETAEKTVIGMALYYIRYSTWKGKALYLEDLIVRESWRGNGIGQQLLDAILKEAKEQRLRQVRWQVLNWIQPAIAFYQKNKAMLDDAWINCTIDFA